MHQALNVQLLKQHANIVFSSENVTHFSLGHLGIMYQAHCTASNGKLGRDLGTRLTHQIIGSSTSTAGQDSRHLSCLTKLSVHIFAAMPLSLHPLDTIQSYVTVNRLDLHRSILDYHSKFPSLYTTLSASVVRDYRLSPHKTVTGHNLSLSKLKPGLDKLYLSNHCFRFGGGYNTE